jgi:RHS repeat-associated protein
VKEAQGAMATYYVRSTVLGRQVVAELNGSGGWSRGYVYLGGQMLAMQAGGVSWVHQDPVTKSQRVTNSSGAVVSTIDLDPWGGETNRSANSVFQPHKYTTYERDGNGGDDAMHRRYQSNWTRFSQPDPYDGSYEATNPQSFNRYSYVQNDPVNFTDPSGLLRVCYYSQWGYRIDVPGYPGGIQPLYQLDFCIDYPDLPSEPRELREPRGGRRDRPERQHVQPDRSQQQQFNDCARKAGRTFKKGYLKESLRAVGGGALVAGNIYVAVRGIPGTGPAGGIGVKAAVEIGLSQGIEVPVTVAQVGLQAGFSLGFLGLYMIGRSIQEANKNEAIRNAAIEKCKWQFPHADHSWSSLNF